MTTRRALGPALGLLILASASLLACGGGAAGQARDAAPGDAPELPADAAGPDVPDAPAADVASEPDGAADAAPADAGRVDEPAIPCADSVADVYVTPAGLPPMTPGARGDLVRCAPDVTYTVAEVQTQITGKGIATPAQSGAALFRVAYRTMRSTGAAGVSSARVYLPTTPHAGPLPVIAVGHATSGLAPSCAPSRDATTNVDLALPWAALGYAVIVPDYAGLGNDDPVQGYVDNRDTGYSLLDGARALRRLLPAGALSPQVLLVGWSQGGGAALSAQALAPSYGCDGSLAAVIVFAPEWPTRMNSFGYVDLLSNPTELTIQHGISDPVVAVLRQYAYGALHVDPTHATDSFPAANRAGIGTAVMSLCEKELGGYLQGVALHVGDFLDDTFRQTLLACVNGPVDGGPGCDEPVHTYFTFLQDNVLTADAAGPPLLFVQGLLDTVMPPGREAACTIAKLQAEGVSPQVCTDASALHTTVVPRNADLALAWGQAILAGTAPPSCSAAGLPACAP